MKIGLITFHDTTNFGSLLQTYGLYKKIEELGYNCEIIDYQCESISQREVPQSFHLSLNPKILLKDLIFGTIRRKKYKELHRFLTHEMQLSSRVVRSSLPKIENDYKKFIIGSDITWGMDIIGKDLTFFLDFVKDSHKKTAFASSIGNPWTNEDKKLIKPYLNDFDYIAVREEESADWVEEVTSIRPKVVCDPTMLISVDVWRRFCVERKDKDNYVLVYFDTLNGDCLMAAKKYANKYRLKVKMISYGKPQKGVVIVRPTSLEEFLTLISNAAFIVTASYHGMLFSVYFNRQFAYFNRAHKSRMATLSRRIRVEDRDGSKYDVLHMEAIDYNIVNAAVEEYRNESTESLIELLTR